jgi:uncharacterized protein YbjT (DUF2867 family)
MTRHRAIVAGASGLVGRACLDTLLAHAAYERVTSFGRRSLGRSTPTLTERIVALDDLAGEPAEPADHAFCALGTTIRTAGSREAFRRVDLLMVASFAAFARRAGATTFVLVSSVGADAASANFYLRVKGEAERAAIAEGFAAVHVLRPGVLLGARAERRAGEAVAQAVMPWLGPLLAGPLRRYRGIAAETVGRAMVGTALAGRAGTGVLHFDGIVAAAGRVEEAA